MATDRQRNKISSLLNMVLGRMILRILRKRSCTDTNVFLVLPLSREWMQWMSEGWPFPGPFHKRYGEGIAYDMGRSLNAKVATI